MLVGELEGSSVLVWLAKAVYLEALIFLTQRRSSSSEIEDRTI